MEKALTYGDGVKVESVLATSGQKRMPMVAMLGTARQSDIRVTVKNYETLNGQITATVTKAHVTLTAEQTARRRATGSR